MFDLISEMKIFLIPIIFGLIVFIMFFAAVFYIIISQIIKNKKNRQQPILLENAVVISKRTKVSQQKIGTTVTYRNVTRYFITFQFESGVREEFLVSDNDYGMIAENDRGKLKYQGTDFISFIRE